MIELFIFVLSTGYLILSDVFVNNIKTEEIYNDLCKLSGTLCITVLLYLYYKIIKINKNVIEQCTVVFISIIILYIHLVTFTISTLTRNLYYLSVCSLILTYIKIYTLENIHIRK